MSEQRGYPASSLRALEKLEIARKKECIQGEARARDIAKMELLNAILQELQHMSRKVEICDRDPVEPVPLNGAVRQLGLTDRDVATLVGWFEAYCGEVYEPTPASLHLLNRITGLAAARLPKEPTDVPSDS